MPKPLTKCCKALQIYYDKFKKEPLLIYSAMPGINFAEYHHVDDGDMVDIYIYHKGFHEICVSCANSLKKSNRMLNLYYKKRYKITHIDLVDNKCNFTFTKN